MTTIALIVTVIIGLLHCYILWFEMFAWESRGPKIFADFPKDLFPKTTVLAANQGLYNGFLAAGLFWPLFISDPVWKQYIAVFFLLCVVIAGVYGAATASKRILYVQALPAAVAILLWLLG